MAGVDVRRESQLGGGEDLGEVEGCDGGEATDLEERASNHGLMAPRAKSRFVSAQDAACRHLSGPRPPSRGCLIGISGLSVGIAVAEGHRPRTVEQPSRTEDIIKPLSHVATAAWIFPLLDRQDHVVADLHQPPQRFGRQPVPQAQVAQLVAEPLLGGGTRIELLHWLRQVLSPKSLMPNFSSVGIRLCTLSVCSA